jgi:hypothetical protein
MIDWILKNKEWLLSGLGITIIGFFVKKLTMLFDKSPNPFLEIEIPQVYGTKQSGEISRNNPSVIPSTEVVRYNSILWRYEIIIRNNSSQTAYSPKLKFIGKQKFDYIEPLNSQSPITSNASVTLQANFKKEIESKADEAIKFAKTFFPDELIGLTIHIEYQNDIKKRFKTIFKVQNSKEYVNK